MHHGDPPWRRDIRWFAGLAIIAVLGCTLAGTPDAKLRGPRGTLASARLLALHATLGRIPLSFEANHGQADRRVTFLAHSPGSTLFLTATDAVLRFSPRAAAGGASGHGEPPCCGCCAAGAVGCAAGCAPG